MLIAVALKVVPKATVLEGGGNWLARERDALVALAPCPAIVTLLGSSQDDVSVCLLFELLAGGDLAAHLTYVPHSKSRCKCKLLAMLACLLLGSRVPTRTPAKAHTSHFWLHLCSCA